MKIALFTILISSVFAAQLPTLKDAQLCASTKEYIATLEYLRDFKALDAQEKVARDIADKVSTGCNGAFNRFAKVSKMLIAVGIDSATALKHSVAFAADKDENAQLFIELFRQTYNEENLDLDALNALTISLEVARNNPSESKLVLEDFKKLVSYCKEEKTLGLPAPFCAQVSAKITALGSKFEKAIADEYIKLTRFISENNKGPTTDKKYAMNLSEKIIAYGPKSAENFINAYRFAVSKKGLSYSAKDAISFAEKMASRSYQLESKN